MISERQKRRKIGVRQQESGGGGSKEIGKEGEIVPDLDLRGSGPSDVSIS